MQLEVKPYELPAALSFNYEELKAALTEKVKFYETAVYGDEDIKQAKADRADLNRLKKALSDERIRRKKEYLAPFEDFEKKINEIIAIIDKPAAIIDQRVKEFEQAKKDEKKMQIQQIFDKIGFPEYITLGKIWDEAWLNSTCSLSRVKEDLKTIAYRDQQAMETLQNLPEYAFEAAEYYKEFLDVTAAMAKANDLARIQRAKQVAEEQAKKPEAPAKLADTPITDPEEEPETAWVKFECKLTIQQAAELRGFFIVNGIEFRAIR